MKRMLSGGTGANGGSDMMGAGDEKTVDSVFPDNSCAKGRDCSHDELEVKSRKSTPLLPVSA